MLKFLSQGLTVLSDDSVSLKKWNGKGIDGFFYQCINLRSVEPINLHTAFPDMCSVHTRLKWNAFSKVPLFFGRCEMFLTADFNVNRWGGVFILKKK